VILRPFFFEETACASYLFGCLSKSALAVVDPHEELVKAYLAGAEGAGAPIVAVFETHVQADHRSGLPALLEGPAPRPTYRRARRSTSRTTSWPTVTSWS
jgi:hydroxyacylglutathione hydrolase